MSPGTILQVVLSATLALALVGPAVAQNPWTADGGYYEQYDGPPGRFKTQTLRWVWFNHTKPAVPDDFVAYFRCWRIGPEEAIGTNKFVVRWKLTGLDSNTKIKLPKWAVKLDEGFLEETRVVNQVAQLAGESMVLVEALLKVKGTIGADEYVGCAMDLSQHPDGFAGF